MKDLNYTEDGFLIVSELYKCPFWEKVSIPCNMGWNTDCFFCAYADFRKLEYIKCMENEPRKGVLYSVCHNEKNRKNTKQETLL